MQLKKKRKRRQSVSATEEPGLLEAREDDRKERRRGRKVEDVVTSAGEGRGRWSGRCGHGSDPERGLDDCSVNSNPLRQGTGAEILRRRSIDAGKAPGSLSCGTVS